MPVTEQGRKEAYDKDDDCVICLNTLRYAPSDELLNSQINQLEVADIEA